MLYFIPTPIGNIEDLSIRSLEILKQTDLIFCEDTRMTKKLLNLIKEKFSIDLNIKEFISMHSHNEKKIIEKLSIELFSKIVVYMSDAGMPCISDPGSLLVDFAQKNNIKYEVLPGANAAITAYASSGFSEKEFLFFGFLSHQGNERKKELAKILNSPYNVIIYESPYRIQRLINEISLLEPEKELFVIKEISKLHQKQYKDNAKNLNKLFETVNLKGEWVVVLKGKITTNKTISINDILQMDLPPKIKAKILSKVSEKSIKQWYQELIS